MDKLDLELLNEDLLMMDDLKALGLLDKDYTPAHLKAYVEPPMDRVAAAQPRGQVVDLVKDADGIWRPEKRNV